MTRFLKSEYLIVMFGVLAYILVIFYTNFLKLPLPTFHFTDEDWHYLVIQKYHIDFLNLKFTTYESSNTPLYYYIMSLIGFPFNYNIQFLRWINLLFSIAALFVFFQILNKRIGFDIYKSLFFTLIFGLSPYVFGISFILLTDNFTLLLAFIAIYYFLTYNEDGGLRSVLLGAVFSGLTVFSRQNYIWIYSVGGMVVLLNNTKLYKKLLSLALLGTTLLPLLFLFFTWKGFTPPGHQSHHETLTPNFSSVTLSLSLFGFYSIFFISSEIIESIKQLFIKNIQYFKDRVDYLFVIVGILVFSILYPVNRDMAGTDGFFLQVARFFPSIFGNSIVLWIFVTLGGLYIYHYTVKQKNYLLLIVIISFLVVNLPSKLMFQKYFDYFVLFMVIVLFPKRELHTMEKVSLNLLLFFFVSYAILHIYSSGGITK